MIATLSPPIHDTADLQEILDHYLASRDSLLTASRRVETPGLQAVFEDVAIRRSLVAERMMELRREQGWSPEQEIDAEAQRQHWWLKARQYFGDPRPRHVLHECIGYEQVLLMTLQEALDS